MERMIPRYRWAEIRPRDSRVQRGPGYQFYRIAPLDVMWVDTPLGITDYTEDAVEEAIARFWTCVDELARKKSTTLCWAVRQSQPSWGAREYASC